MLMKDGRIHPARIEEVVAKAKKQIEKEVRQAGEDAMRETGVVGIPKEMLLLLGELKFRTSFGQNVLKHSTEMAQIDWNDCRRKSARMCELRRLRHFFMMSVRQCRILRVNIIILGRN